MDDIVEEMSPDEAADALGELEEETSQEILEEMEQDESVVYMGQDIGVFEGAFRSTKGLHTRWPQRVFDTHVHI